MREESVSASLGNTPALVMWGKAVTPREPQSLEDSLVPRTPALTWLLYWARSHCKQVKRRTVQPVLLNIEGVLSPNGLLKVIYPIFKYKGKKNYSVLFGSFPNDSSWPVSGDICCRKVLVPAVVKKEASHKFFVFKLIWDNKWADFLACLYMRVGVMSWSYVSRRRARQ